jgi:hypothetical protein
MELNVRNGEEDSDVELDEVSQDAPGLHCSLADATPEGDAANWIVVLSDIRQEIGRILLLAGLSNLTGAFTALRTCRQP